MDNNKPLITNGKPITPKQMLQALVFANRGLADNLHHLRRNPAALKDTQDRVDALDKFILKCQKELLGG